MVVLGRGNADGVDIVAVEDLSVVLGDRDLGKCESLKKAAQKAYELAEIKEPAKEIDLAEEFCPDCGSRTEHESGCLVCRSCGYSKC